METADRQYAWAQAETKIGQVLQHVMGHAQCFMGIRVYGNTSQMIQRTYAEGRQRIGITSDLKSEVKCSQVGQDSTGRLELGKVDLGVELEARC